MKTCTNCSISYPDDKKFCKNCGNPLVETATQENKEILKKKVVVRIPDKKQANKNDDIQRMADLSEIAISKDDYDEALLLINKGLLIDQNNKSILVKKAELLFKMKNETECISTWNKVYELDPENVSACLFLGIEAVKFEDFQKACNLLELVISKSKNENEKSTAMFYCAFSILRLNVEDKRLPFFIIHSKLDSYFDTADSYQKNILEELLFFYGDYNVQQKNYESAIYNFETAYQLNKDNKFTSLIANAYYKLAKNKFDLGERKNSRINIEKALALFPGNKEYRSLLEKIIILQKKKKRKLIIGIIVVMVSIILILVGIWVSTFLIEKNAWDKALSENKIDSYQKYLNTYPNGKYIDEANQMISKTEAIMIDSVAEAIFESIPDAKKNTITINSKVEDILKAIGKTNEALPNKNSGVNSFSTEEKISKNIISSVTYGFNSDIKEPIKKITGKNWYGEPTFIISGYQNSTKALFDSFDEQIRLDSQFASKTEAILKAICDKIEKSGFSNYSKQQQNSDIKCFINENAIIIVKKSDNLIIIRYNNTNFIDYSDLLQRAKAGIIY